MTLASRKVPEVGGGAAEAGDAGEVDRLEGVGDDLVGVCLLLEDRPDREAIVALADDEGRGEVFFDSGAAEGAGVRGEGEEKQERK